MRVNALLFVLGLILFSFGSAVGQGIYLDHVDGLVNGEIPEGGTLTFHMRIVGDATPHLMMNNGFTFSSANCTWGGLTGEYTTEYPVATWFDFVRVINLWANGSVEDTVGTGLLSLFGAGLPVDFDGVLYSFTIGPLSGPAGDALVFDSSWYPPSNPWMWDIVGENVAWGGPYTFLMQTPCVAPEITSAPVTDGIVGSLYTYDVDATGTPAPTYSLVSPPGDMVIDPSTGVITWTPAAPGDYPVTVVATNTCDTDTQEFTVHVLVPCVAPVITSTPVTDGEVDVLYTYDVDATGTPAPTYSLVSPPGDMAINPTTGVINWTPAAPGDYPVTVVATNDCDSDTQEFTVHVPVPCTAPQIVSTPVTDGEIGMLYSYDVDATGDPTPGYVLTEAPGTMMINPATGLITWTPTSSGDFPVSVLAFNDCGEDTQDFVIHVPEPCVPVAITSTPPSLQGVVMELYSYDVEATGSPAPTFSLVAPPAQMTINSTTGLIEWYPVNCGDYEITVVASNGCGDDAVQTFTVAVFEAPGIFSDPITEAFLDEPYSYDVESYGCPSLLVFSLLEGSPEGMTINPTSGLIEWTPDELGEFPVGVQACVTGSPFPCDEQWFNITVVEAPASPVITSIPVTAGQAGVPYIYDVEATGNPAPTFSLTEAPTNMTIDPATGLIEWTPDTGDEYDVTVRAENGVNPPATQSFTIVVVEAPIIVSTPVVDAMVGQPYVYNVDATGYPSPTFELTVAPDGMTIDEFNGVIDWIPTSLQVGDNSVTVVASNGVTPDAVQSFVIVVPDEPYTDCWPQPTILKDLENDRILDVRIYNEDPENVITGSIVVQGKIPPYTGVTIEGGVITTDCFIMRFLGSSGFRPVNDDFEATYTVEYDKLVGDHTVLTGDFELQVYPGDVTLDGQANIDDLIFASEYFWKDGPVPSMSDKAGKGWEITELLDVNKDGSIDPRDVIEIRNIVF